jgi:alkaline phosphatase D
MSFTRRYFARALAFSALPAALSRRASGQVTGLFQHGIASGDPLQDRVILWTRVSPPVDEDSIPVQWRVATDPQMTEVLSSGDTTTGPLRDYTVKVDATGLQPGTSYYYQFEVRGTSSKVGRTKTLPEGSLDRVRFAVTSCSNFPYGYFNAYRMIAERSDLDCVLHLGDYIYEYDNATYGNAELTGRYVSPHREITTLSEYRERYATSRTDPDLQEVHRQHPFFLVWDDHESANDAWKDGAENHDEGEGEWKDRLAASIQAWYEWLPVRETEPKGQIYRSYRFGDLMDLTLLDTRIIGRDQQAPSPASPALLDPSRSLLGAEQEAWFFRELAESQQRGAQWRVVGQQVMMGQLFNTDGTPFNVDQWDGYLPSRIRLLTHLATSSISNVVILTGDIHSSWGNDITGNPFDPAGYSASTGRGSQAVEFVTPAITSPGIDDAAMAALLEGQIRATHPHVKYVNLFRRGYVLVDLTRERAQAEWYHVRTIMEPRAEEELARVLKSDSGASTLTPGEQSAARTDQAPLAP